MRLILVPQYPTKMRYQEWWWNDFPRQLKPFFSDVLVLGIHYITNTLNTLKPSDFAPIELSMALEVAQMEEYVKLELKVGDVLLLNDLSFPGNFASLLFLKRPDKAFAICHATAKNRYDIFSKIRQLKFKQEKVYSKLFDKIIVGSNYHKNKLGWGNIEVLSLPLPPFDGLSSLKLYDVVSLSRKNIQKRTVTWEKRLEKDLGLVIEDMNVKSWQEYYAKLSMFKIVLITSKEETYGYQIVDAFLNNCFVIAPNNYSYPEILPNMCLYDNYEDMKKMVSNVLHFGLKNGINDFKVKRNAELFFDKLGALLCQ